LPGDFRVHKAKTRLDEKKVLLRTDYKITLEHSKRLILGLDAILVGDIKGSMWAIKVESEGGGELKKFAEQHLETGYPSIYKKLKAYRQLRDRTKSMLEQKGYPKRIINFVVDGTATFPNLEELEKWPWCRPNLLPQDLGDILERTLSVYKELEKEINLLKDRIDMGEPLGGGCESCPNVSILE